MKQDLIINGKRAFFLAAFMCFSVIAFSQQDKKISGTVTSLSGNNALPGVSILVKGTSTGTVTDIDGNYSINVPDGNNILIFSFIGFTTQEVSINERSTIDVALGEDIQSLEEIVVVGYGEQKKATATGSVSVVDGESLQKSPATNVTNTLSGRLPGLVAVTRTGEPGNDNSMLRIRGSNTLGDNSPLIVIDGIANRDMSRLKPSDIETLTVLKDASAAIYGAQAANGVILITTKRGSEGKLQVNLNINKGWSTPTVLPEMADAASYAQMINEIKYYAGQPARYTAEEIQKFKDGSDPLLYPNTDWFAETVKPLSPQHYADISLSGGTEKLKYFVSLGTNYQDGMYYNSASNYSQADFRSNIDAKLSDNIRLSLDLSGRQENRNYPGVKSGALDPFWAMNRAYPYLPAKWQMVFQAQMSNMELTLQL
jgi:TonB-linked SusC/RagA family outer membrane protein